jgi:hypothetical protein
VRALRWLRRRRPGPRFRGWLRGITRNQVLLYFRRNQGRPQAEGGSDALGRLQDAADPLAGSVEDEAQEVSQLYRQAVEQVRGEFEERCFSLNPVVYRTPGSLRATPCDAERYADLLSIVGSGQAPRGGLNSNQDSLNEGPFASRGYNERRLLRSFPGTVPADLNHRYRLLRENLAIRSSSPGTTNHSSTPASLRTVPRWRVTLASAVHG